MLEAALLENVPGDTDEVREEAFGPVVILSKFTDWETALAEVNDRKFGLQDGLFTRDIHKVLGAWDHLDVGGIVVNDEIGVARGVERGGLYGKIEEAAGSL